MEHADQVVEQIIRPTGLVDPEVEVRPTKGQVDDLVGEIRQRVERGERVLVTTLTKRMSEDLTEYLKELGIKVQYLHSEVETLERVGILRDLRLGVFDVLVGINLLREGLDLPEVSLVAILDADKEGFLRSDTALIQTIGRAARQCERTCDHVCRPDDQFDEARDRRNESPPRQAGEIQRGERHHADQHSQGDPRPDRGMMSAKAVGESEGRIQDKRADGMPRNELRKIVDESGKANEGSGEESGVREARRPAR